MKSRRRCLGITALLAFAALAQADPVGYAVTSYVIPSPNSGVSLVGVTDLGVAYGDEVLYDRPYTNNALLIGFSASNGVVTDLPYSLSAVSSTVVYAASSGGVLAYSNAPFTSGKVLIQNGASVINTGLPAYTTPGFVSGLYMPSAVNNSGTLVGLDYLAGGGGATPFEYQNGSVNLYSAQSPLPAGSYITFSGINDLGQSVGLAHGTQNNVAFILSNGIYTPILTESFSSDVGPTSINDSGVVSFSNGELYQNGQFYMNGAGFSIVDFVSNAGVLLGYDGDPSTTFSVAVPTSSPVPEPGTLTLLGAAGLIFIGSRKLLKISA